MEIQFKVTEQSKQNFEISLKNISASNGNEDIKIEDIKTEISLEDDDNIIPTDPSGNNTNGPFIDDPETPNGVGNNIVNGNGILTNQTIPDTGSSNSMLAVFIGVAGILAVVSFIKMRKNEERI